MHPLLSPAWGADREEAISTRLPSNEVSGSILQPLSGLLASSPISSPFLCSLRLSSILISSPLRGIGGIALVNAVPPYKVGCGRGAFYFGHSTVPIFGHRRRHCQ